MDGKTPSRRGPRFNSEIFTGVYIDSEITKARLLSRLPFRRKIRKPSVLAIHENLEDLRTSSVSCCQYVSAPFFFFIIEVFACDWCMSRIPNMRKFLGARLFRINWGVEGGGGLREVVLIFFYCEVFFYQKKPLANMCWQYLKIKISEYKVSNTQIFRSVD